MNCSTVPWEDWRTLQQKRGAQFTTSSQEPLKADYETPGATVLGDWVATISWAFSPGTPPGSYGEDLRESPSGLWHKEGKRNPCEIHSEPLHDKGQLDEEKLGEGLGSHFNPSSLLVSTKEEVMGGKHL